MAKKFKNIETYVLLEWLVREFDERYQRYKYTGDDLLIAQVIESAAKGRFILAKMKEPLQEISKNLNVDLGHETVSYQIAPDVPRANVTFLWFGALTKELESTYAVRFIVQLLNEKMGIKTPSLKFKLFYLPPVPVATTEEGHVLSNLEGFTSIGRKLIGINIYSQENFEAIFRTAVHEIIHVCFLENSQGDDVGEVEAKVEECVKTFLEKCRKEYMSEKEVICQSLRDVFEEKSLFFQKVDDALDTFADDLRQANIVINDIMRLFDAILDGRVNVTGYFP